MKIAIMIEKYVEEVVDMMRTFYASPAVLTNGSEEIFRSDVENCINDCPYLEGYVFLEEEKLVGYAMVAKSFSTEYGKRCMWIEDIYLKPEYQGRGLASQFFVFLDEKYPDCLLRLEVEEENERAIHVYRKNGFDVMPYIEMKK